MIFSLIFWAVVVYFLVRATWGRKKKYFRWLARQIPLWESAQLINQAQADSILAYYRLKRAVPGKFDMVKMLTLAGSLFIGIGVIFFVASNWPGIPNHLKTVILLGVTISALMVGYFFSFQKQGFTRAGKALLLLATLFWGTSLMLIAQMYNLPVDQNWQILLVWAFPILPVAFVYKNEYVHLLASVLFLVWNFLYSGSTAAPNYFYPLLVMGLLLPTARMHSASHYVNIAGLAGASIYCAYHSFEWLALFISVGLVACFWLKKEARGYLYAASISFTSWTVAFFMARNLQPNFFFLLSLAVLWHLTYKEHAGENCGILLASLFLWSNLTFYSFCALGGYGVGFAGYLLLALCFGVGAYGAGMASAKSGKHFASLYKLFGYFLSVVLLYLFSFRAIANLAVEAINPVLIAIVLVTVGGVLWGVFESRKRRYLSDKSFMFELCAILLLAIVAVIFLCTKSVIVNFLAVNAALVAYALLTIAVGAQRREPFVCNLGIAVFALYIITRYIDVGWQLKERSLFFVGGGVVILLLGMYLEKSRRKMLEGMK